MDWDYISKGHSGVVADEYELVSCSTLRQFNADVSISNYPNLYTIDIEGL